LPEGAITRHEKTDKIPYRDWITDGWVSKTEGDVTDYEVIIDNLFDRAEKYHWIVLEVAYDPWNGTFFATSIAKKGLTCVEIRQGVQTLSEPTKLFRTMVTQGKIVHDGSPLLKMAFANAKVITDNNGNIKLSKEDKDDRHRIDPLAALINAMVRLAALKEGPKESIYNKRGIRTL
jgi:Phage terminase-like protein, large subunit